MIWLRSLSGYQRLGLVTIAGLLTLITLGGTVRVTDSGLACPDWPLCNGELVPGGDYHVWIEWTHRLVASLIGFVIVAFVVGAWRKHRNRPWVIVPALAGVVALGVQVVLGGLTVTENLPAEIVTAHLATAMLIVLLMLTSWLATFVPARSTPPVRTAAVPAQRRLTGMIITSAVGLLSLMILGSYVSGTEAGFFCNQDWPLCNGSLLPEGNLASIQVAHRYLAAFVGLLMAGMWLTAYRQRRSGTQLFWLATLVVVLFGAQVMLGAAMMWTTLADWTRVTHLGVAAVTWVTMVGMTGLAIFRSGWVPSIYQQRPLPTLFRGRVQAGDIRQ